MTHKFKMLSHRANAALAAILNGPNAAGEMPAVTWFSMTTLRTLESRKYITTDDEGTLSVTDLGRAYRAWSIQQDKG